MVIAVTGASGQLGRLAIEALKKRAGADEVVALARTPEKLADLGVATRVFDYDDVATLAPALTGVDALVFVSSSEIGKRIEQHRNVIAAAKAAGVGRIVYTSVLRADTSALSVADEHRPTEIELEASGLSFTVLRNGWYNENYAGSVAGSLHDGILVGSSGEGKISSAARGDYAEALAVAATTDGHDGKIYELAGDDAWTLADLAGEVSRQTGRNIPYRDLPEADYAAALAGAGVPEVFARAIAGWDVEASRGALFDSDRQLSWLIGRPTTPISATVAEAIK